MINREFSLAGSRFFDFWFWFNASSWAISVSPRDSIFDELSLLAAVNDFALPLKAILECALGVELGGRRGRARQ